MLAGSFCVYKERQEGAVLGGAAGERHAIGEARLSRNGRYALFVALSELYGASSFVDLADGASQRFPGTLLNFGYSAQAVADDGSVVYARYGSPPQLLLWSAADGDTILPTTGVPANAVIDAAARVVVYDAWIEDDAPRRLFALERASGKTILLATDAERASITRDGAQVLYLGREAPGGPRQPFLIRSDGTEKRLVARVPEGAREAAISGNGLVAFAVTEHNRLLRIDVTTGEIAELAGRTPYITQLCCTAVPGSILHVSGSGLAGEVAAFESTPLPTSLAGTEVRIQGRAMPLVWVAPEAVLLQVAWEFSPGTLPSVSVVSGDSGFDSPPFQRSDMGSLPVFEKLTDRFPVAVHEDWSALVTPENPARAGEIVHFYMTGLGPTDPPVPTGMPSPSDPPARLASRFDCQVVGPRDNNRNAEVLWAGLAPTFFGVYQVSLRLPPDFGQFADTGSVGIACTGYAFTSLPAKKP